jgi:hypothetical protein
MDVFKFLDEAVRGAIFFFYSIVATTLTMVRHPVAGPGRLWLASRTPAARQISPLTYLAAMFVVLSLAQSVSLREAGPGGGAEFAGLARLFATGSVSSELVPLLAGALTATILVDALLRALARWRFRARRAEKFVAVMEYGSGFFLLFGGTLVVIISSFLAEEYASAISVPLIYAAGSLPALHLYGQLSKSRRWYGLIRTLPRKVRRTGQAGASAWLAWLGRRLARPGKTLRLLGIGYLKVIAGMFVTLLAASIPTGGIVVGRVAGDWLRDLQRPFAAVTLLNLECDLAHEPIVRAIAWNNSSKPAAEWLRHVRFKISDEFGPRYDIEPRRLAWTLPRDAPGPRDLLLPGQVVGLEGTIRPAPGAPAPVDWPDVEEECFADAEAGDVYVSSEGNVVRLPMESATAAETAGAAKPIPGF